MTSPSPEMRASDADRDRVAEALREHCATGRITVDELDERLEAVYAARTFGELARVTADLPEADLSDRRQFELSQGAGGGTVERRPAGAVAHRTNKAMWGLWATVSAINFTVWLVLSVTGTDLIYPWWIWVAGPWGAVLAVGTVFNRDHKP